jgi:SPP1 gp7 family putative phage head morphogenesis protein
MPAPTIYDIAAAHREALLRGDQAAATAMVRAYGQAWLKLQDQLGKIWDTLERQKAEAETEGKPFDPNGLLVFQRDRIEALRSQVEAEIGRIAGRADGWIQHNQREAIQAAGRHTDEMTQAALRLGTAGDGEVLGSFTRVPVEALTDLVGFMRDGSPLRDLLDRMAGQAGKAVERALIQGLATGQNPRTMARAIRKELGYSLARHLTIARTETLRAYREACLRNYQANDDVVDGWIWLSARQSRTCAACWALAGTVHKLSERLEDHPNGRCTMLPVTKNWGELGVTGRGETSIAGRVPLGVDLFDKLPEGQKQAILGSAAYRAYTDGAVKLPDFVGHKTHPRWGGMHYTRSLSEILGPAAAKYYRSGPGPAPAPGSGPAPAATPPAPAPAPQPLTPAQMVEADLRQVEAELQQQQASLHYERRQWVP